MQAHRGDRLQPKRVGRDLPPPAQGALADKLRTRLRDIDRTEVGRFFEEIDAAVDPTPRYWPNP